MDAIVYDKVGKEAEKVREALYGIYPQETITDAAIASFDDGADGIPVKALTVGIEPVQDLHGYDYPWPGGGNKNLLPIDTVVHPSGQSTPDKLIFTGELSGTYTLSIVTDDATAVNPGAAVITIKVDGQWQYDVSFQHKQHVYTGTITNISVLSSTSYSQYTGTVKIQLEAGSTATAWTPYSNICPITGWTGAEVTRTGKNLCPRNVMRTSHNGIDYTIVDDGIRVSGTATDAAYSWMNWMSYDATWIKIPAGTYTFSIKDMFGASQSDGYVVFKGWDANGNTLNDIVLSASLLTATRSFTSDVGLYYGIYVKSGMTVDTVVKIQAEVGSTASAYEPYTGTTVPITFPSESGTVYGGTLILNPDRTGTLKSAYVKRVYDNTADWRWYAPSKSVLLSYGLVGRRGKGTTTNVYGKCNLCGTNSDGIIEYVYSTSLTTEDIQVLNVPSNFGTNNLDEWKALVAETPIELVYELDTPIEYQLTASEVSDILTTLYGTNNVWASTGNIEKLTYRADLGKYIDSHITTAVANALNA